MLLDGTFTEIALLKEHGMETSGEIYNSLHSVSRVKVLTNEL